MINFVSLHTGQQGDSGAPGLPGYNLTHYKVQQLAVILVKQPCL